MENENTNSGHARQISPMKVALFSAIAGAVIGSVLTALIPRLLDHYLRPPEPPVITNVSAKELVEWYKSFENKVHAEEIARKSYYGKHVRWEGTIVTIRPCAIGECFSLFVDVGAKGERGNILVVAIFDTKQDALALTSGKHVVVLGQISSIDDYGVSIRNSRLEGTR